MLYNEKQLIPFDGADGGDARDINMHINMRILSTPRNCWNEKPKGRMSIIEGTISEEDIPEMNDLYPKARDDLTFQQKSLH